MWKRIKKILKTLSPGSKLPQVTREDIPEFSFLMVACCNDAFLLQWTHYGGPLLAVASLQQREPSCCNEYSLRKMQFQGH
ncbi:hypothetical protein HAX54_026640 [Datura stramonium]|uniref:Uncharacterized protein n=1 Tax=Datura stramonium TaxID=4076 RepID=A0ABS8V4C7_DATST|nr:hypothetical protein [Datura stramonium]